MKDQTRNLNPTKEAQVAMIIWGKEYSEQRGGSMDFWDRLSDERKRRCELVVKKLNPTPKTPNNSELEKIQELHDRHFADQPFTIEKMAENPEFYKEVMDAFLYDVQALLHTETQRAVEEVNRKVVLYVSQEQDHYELSHEDRLKLNSTEVVIWLGDTVNEVWGDDWDDAPDESNSGSPYPETVKGLEKIVVKLGEPLATINHKEKEA